VIDLTNRSHRHDKHCTTEHDYLRHHKKPSLVFVKLTLTTSTVTRSAATVVARSLWVFARASFAKAILALFAFALRARAFADLIVLRDFFFVAARKDSKRE
jgi:hypothetical protein